MTHPPGGSSTPTYTTSRDANRTWQRADAIGVDSLWPWDHFFPIFGDPGGASFEGWALLAAVAVDTQNAQLGVLVTAAPYRDPTSRPTWDAPSTI